MAEDAALVAREAALRCAVAPPCCSAEPATSSEDGASSGAAADSAAAAAAAAEESSPVPDGAWVTMITPFLATSADDDDGAAGSAAASASASSGGGGSSSSSGGDGGIDWAHVDALVDMYVSAGVAGIFAVCQSSEMYYLSDDERLALAARVVKRANGRCAVVAGGTFPEHAADPVQRATFVKRMHAETGVAAVVVICSALFGPAAADDEAADEAAWLAAVRELVSLTADADVPLGLYECPVPRHRLLSPEALVSCVATGRFLFHKDTCCTLDGLEAKLKALRACTSPAARSFKLFNANVATLSASLGMGAAGFCGIAGNVWPELFASLCNAHAYLQRIAHKDDQRARASTLRSIADSQAKLSVLESVIAHQYPQSAKKFLALCRPKQFATMTDICRTPPTDRTWKDEDILRLAHAGMLLGLRPHDDRNTTASREQ